MLYVEVTSNLDARLWQHRMRLTRGWPERYGVLRLVYFEVAEDVMSAIEREKEIKGWVRRKKVALISLANPEWKDLSDEWSHPLLDPSPRSG